MSECVVRMEMPQNCGECRFRSDGWCYGIWEFDPQPGPLDFEKRPGWCPIICALPEGHGRLVDIDRKFLRVATDGHGMSFNWRGSIADMIDADNMRGVEIIVPAERSET